KIVPGAAAAPGAHNSAQVAGGQAPCWNLTSNMLLQKPPLPARRKDEDPGDVLLLGDSVLSSWKSPLWRQSFPGLKELNHAVNGWSSGLVLKDIVNGNVPERSPRLIWLLVGSNDVKGEGKSPRAAAEGVAKIVWVLRNLYPETPILLIANLPHGVEPS